MRRGLIAATAFLALLLAGVIGGFVGSHPAASPSAIAAGGAGTASAAVASPSADEMRVKLRELERRLGEVEYRTKGIGFVGLPVRWSGTIIEASVKCRAANPAIHGQDVAQSRLTFSVSQRGFSTTPLRVRVRASVDGGPGAIVLDKQVFEEIVGPGRRGRYATEVPLSCRNIFMVRLDG
jgi:hypothetical protein